MPLPWLLAALCAAATAAQAPIKAAPLARAVNAHVARFAAQLPPAGVPATSGDAFRLAQGMSAQLAVAPPGAPQAAAALILETMARPETLPALKAKLEAERGIVLGRLEINRAVANLERLAELAGQTEARGPLLGTLDSLHQKLLRGEGVPQTLNLYFEGRARASPEGGPAVDAADWAARHGAAESAFAAALARASTEPVADDSPLNDAIGRVVTGTPGPFTPDQRLRLARGLRELLQSRSVLQRWLEGDVAIVEDAGSGQSIATQSLRSKFGFRPTPEQESLIYGMYQQLVGVQRLPEGGDAGAAWVRFSRSVTTRHPHLRLQGSGQASEAAIDAARTLLELLPEELLGSEMSRRRLRGGLDLSADRLGPTRIGHYDDETGQLGIQPTVFSARELIEVMLHELGHPFEDFLKDPELGGLMRRAVRDRYALPALGFSASTRRDYIGSLNELFAETFMHFVLHGELMAQGFPGLVEDAALWQKVYAAYRDKVFAGVEYRVRDGRLRAIRQPSKRREPPPPGR